MPDVSFVEADVSGEADESVAPDSREQPEISSSEEETTETEDVGSKNEASVQTHLILFVSNGGTEVSPQTVNDGEAAKRPSDPTREGFSFAGWYADDGFAEAYDFSSPVAQDVTLYAKWRPDDAMHTVSFVLVYDEYVTNAEEFNPIAVSDGQPISKPEEPQAYIGVFQGWYADLDCTEPFDFSQPVVENISLVAKWDLDRTDTDADSLSDGLEDYLGTDINDPDTDSDGLPDGVEIEVATNPLKADTDDDGASDRDEDYDGDTLANGAEVLLGTDPANADTDGDDIPDDVEIETHGTDPLKADTDGDGAEDGWEILYEFDPLKFDETFKMTVGSFEPSESSPVVAAVEMEVSGEQAATVSVKRVSVVDNPLVDPSIPGYMGPAYEFSVEGDFDYAHIYFTYDAATFGDVDETFDPIIYYVNEETGRLERPAIVSQIRNKVSVKVTHFSTYILLNGAEFDEAWETEIKPPLQDGGDGDSSLDVVFAIDYSYSMEYNDPSGLRLEATKRFVEKLREDIDRAAVVKFIRPAELICDLTSDKSLLNSAIDGIVNDDGFNDEASGTCGSAALRASLDALEGSHAANKYIILLTDGEDTYYEYRYSDLVAEAAAKDIRIYTVGLGDSIDTTTLEYLSSKTDGKHYHATTGFDLDDAFDQIESGTVDLAADVNNDGIPDYYSNLIYTGELLLSNGSRELVGVDFNYDRNGNPSDDYDGDGVKNGEELEIVTMASGTVYLRMISNPLYSTSNSAETGPDVDLTKTFDTKWADGLLEDDNYAYTGRAENLVDNWASTIDPALSSLFGTNKNEVFRKTLMGYLESYSCSFESMEEYYQRRAIIESTATMKARFVKSFVEGGAVDEEKADAIDFFNGLIEEAMTSNELSLVITKYEDALAIFAGAFPNGTVYVYAEPVTKVTRKVIEVSSPIVENAEKLGMFFDALAITGVAVDSGAQIYDVATLSASNTALSHNIEVLKQLESNASSDHISKAAAHLREALAGDYSNLILDVIEDNVLDLTVVVGEIALANPYTVAVLLVKDAVGIVFGIGEHYEHKFQMIGLFDLSTAYVTLFENKTMVDEGAYWPITFGDVSALRYLSDVAQLRIMGEKEYVAYEKLDGLAGWIAAKIGAHADINEYLNEQIQYVQTRAMRLELLVDRSLYA